MFKFIKRILIFFIAAFMALFLFACVSTLLDPNAQEEQQQIEQAQAEAELKKKEREELENSPDSPNELRKKELSEKVDVLIPDAYKSNSTYCVDAATPTDKSLKGLFLNIQIVNLDFADEENCRIAAVEILNKIKNVDDINRIRFNFIDDYNIRYQLVIEDWETYKEKGIDGNTLEFIEQQ